MSGLETTRVLEELVRDAEKLYNSRVERGASASEIAEATGRWYGLRDALRAVVKEWG